MSPKKRILMAFWFLFLALCFGVVCVCVCLQQKTDDTIFLPKSDNEKFLDLQQKYASKLEKDVLKILEPVVGRGKVRVAVQLDLNLKNAQLNQYTRTHNPNDDTLSLQESILTHSLEKQIQNLIQQQHISVVVDGNTRKGDRGIYQPRTQKEMNDYRRLIENAVGLNSRRGDTLEIQNIPFIYSKSPHKISLVLVENLGLFVVAILLFWVALWICFSHHTESSKQKSSVVSQEMLSKITGNPSRIISVVRNWIYMPNSSKKYDWLPIQKVGIILLALDESIVRQVLVALDDDEVRQLAKTMTTLGVIPPQESARILAELYEAMFSGSAVVGNPERVQQILSQTTSRESLNESFLQKNKSLWQDLEKINSDTLAARLENTRAEIVAYILYQLSTPKASDTIQYFQEKKATQILIHLSHIGSLSGDSEKKINKEALETAQQVLHSFHTPSGSEKTSEIISHISNTPMGQTVMKDIQEKEPQLARKLTANLIHFEDIKNWSDKDIQTLLKHTMRTTALDALAHSPIEIQKAIQRNVPSQIWAQLILEIQEKEKTLLPDQISKARQTIIETARSLLQQGKIDI